MDVTQRKPDKNAIADSCNNSRRLFIRTNGCPFCVNNAMRDITTPNFFKFAVMKCGKKFIDDDRHEFRDVSRQVDSGDHSMVMISLDRRAECIFHLKLISNILGKRNLTFGGVKIFFEVTLINKDNIVLECFESKESVWTQLQFSWIRCENTRA